MRNQRFREIRVRGFIKINVPDGSMRSPAGFKRSSAEGSSSFATAASNKYLASNEQSCFSI